MQCSSEGRKVYNQEGLQPMSAVNLDASNVIFILTTCVRPLLENASLVWNLGCMGNVRQLETAQEDGQKKLMG